MTNKNNLQSHGFFKRISLLSSIAPFPLVLVFGLLFASCQKDVGKSDPDAGESRISLAAKKSGGGDVHTVVESQPFSAVANVSACLGYNIRFYGTVDYKINKVYDKNGNLTHFTRVWSIKGLEAERVGMTSVKFDVVAGTEMFSVVDPVLNPSGLLPVVSPNSNVFIHQGTVVLESRDTHERIVLRHQIIQVPGQGNTPAKSGWYIRGQKCGS